MGLSFSRTWQLPAAPEGGGGDGGGARCLSIVFTDTTPAMGYYRSAAKLAQYPAMASNFAAAEAPGATASATRRDLARAADACGAVVLVGHHPLYSPGEHGNAPELIAEYAAALEEGGVDAYLAGHDHIMAHSRGRGAQCEHVLTGAGSEVRAHGNAPLPETQWIGAVHGFTIHSVNATHIAHSYIWADAEAGHTGRAALPGRIAYHITKPLRSKK